MERPRLLKCASMSFVMYCIFAMSFLAIEATTNITTDQSSLLALKAHITNDPHNLLGNWTTSTSVCNWAWITCDSINNRVIVLNLSSMSLTGTIPPHIGNLSFLVHLRLRDNNFHGSLPMELAQLRRLEIIHLGINSFEGKIPPWLNSLPKLQSLYLFSNDFTGSIPSSLWQCRELLQLSLDDNKFTGIISTNIENLSLLKELYLNDNRFEGQIPRRLFNCTSLQILNLSGNRLTGSVPLEIGNLRYLNVVRLHANHLTGLIPSTIFNISTLEVMGIGGNRLSGPIPSTIGLGVNLKKVFLWINELNGRIPDSITNASQLTVLDLNSNSLSGPVPSTLGEDMVAHVCDFGIAKLLGEEDSMTQTRTLATIGYMAPEYGSEGIVSARGDVYSFGILMIETFTRKKPIDNMFEERLSLQCWIKEALPHSVTQVADSNLLVEENLPAKKDCILSILQVALDCTVELPKSRLDITKVLGELENIKTKFQKRVART
ncbi:hypothetical protein LWI29_015331 [Acer saccharum]|uniref:Protein kinase domain-containing protein n=1 Tax=Acer saccharum TaxID=4024 RepID=A0AA39RQE2_ACESA|nr:hypothetical protein LWI29_015331 [Acer saccharum]